MKTSPNVDDRAKYRTVRLTLELGDQVLRMGEAPEFVAEKSLHTDVTAPEGLLLGPIGRGELVGYVEDLHRRLKA